MAQIFPRWTNKLPLLLALGAILILVAGTGFFWYYGSPQYTDVGYQPVQPISYSHKLHAGDLGLDCRYCHNYVETSAYAGVPPTSTCMNCHQLVLPTSEKLEPLRESWRTGKPLAWVRVHKLPDYTYFDHSIHINAGVGCATCHGNVAAMDVVRQVQPLSMGWCLDCHRDPNRYLRPQSEITNMTWIPGSNQEALATTFREEHNIQPSDDCSLCHR